MDNLNILIVEDEVIIAETLQEMLRELGHLNSQRCKRWQEAEALIKSDQFDLAILDINLSGEQEGIQLGHLCAKLGLPYFFLTSYSDRKTIMEAKVAKPGNYVIKPFSPEEIMVAIELSLLHSQPEMEEKLRKAAHAFKLSERESEILRFIVARLSNQEIGEKLFLSLNTVKYHLRHIYTKIGASTKQEVVERVEYIWSEETS